MSTPEPFYSVGQHYVDFTQTTDAEVIALLEDARKWSDAAALSRATVGPVVGRSPDRG